MTQYTVKKGDTLWAIAKKLLGEGNRYREIQKANGLTDTVIRAGMVLRIPVQANLDYEEIGRAFEEAVQDVDNLPSVKKLYDLIGG